MLLFIAVFAGLLGGQLGARGICGSAQVCAGCCAPESDASCCASDQSVPPATAPIASQTLDWKMVVQPLLTLLPKHNATERRNPLAFSRESPRANGLARIERTCARLI